MKFQVGDRVTMLNSGEEGVIKEFINNKMAVVEVEGVSFPVYLDQIDFPYFKLFSTTPKGKKQKFFAEDIVKEKKTGRKPTHEGVMLRFFPVFQKDVFDDDIVEKMKLIVVNTNDEDYNFSYEASFSGAADFSLKGTLHAASDFYLHDVDFERMSENPRFSFEFTLVQPDKKKASYFESSIRLKAKQLFKKIEEIQLNNEPSFPMIMFQKYPDRLTEDAETFTVGPTGRIYEIDQAKRNMPPARSVIDLHIEKLTDKPQSLTPAEILDMQLVTCEKYLLLAMAHKLPDMIVIHGIGEGRLRQEVHEMLRLTKGVKSFVNQYHPLYGFGATEIFFSY